MKLSVIEAKLTGSWARNSAAIQQLPPGSKSFRGFRETGAWVGMTRLKSRIGPGAPNGKF